MIISLVVAASENNAIGKNNALLWNLPNDMRFFKNVTWGFAVAYGRKTFESLGSKPLSGRMNIVITKNIIPGDGITCVNSITKAIDVAKENQYKELMILGGGEIYAATMPIAHKIYITRVHHIFTDADTFFPEINKNDWNLFSEKKYEADDKHAYSYSFQLWQRK